jgi:pilus assembly protein CpaE
VSTTVVVGCADQGLAYELRSHLDEIEETELVFVADSTSEVTEAVLRLEPDVVVLHDRLGPVDVNDVVRDLTLRRPATAHLVIASDTEQETYAAAMAAGARGLLSYPLSFEQFSARLADAAEWAQTMQRLVGDRRAADATEVSCAVAVGVTGAKGGVGTTTFALHLALDVLTENPRHKVLLLDLDLEKGDVGWLLDARHRISVADLAKVADDLSPRTVLDAVFPHESGLHLLLTPLDVREVEEISPQALRRIVSLLRQQYDLVVVDGGSHVTPVQAALVELADEVVVLSTPDVLSLRSLRRELQSWEDLGVRKSNTVRVLLNQASRNDAVQPDTARRLAGAPVVSVALPAMFRKLEEAVNGRDPSLVREQTWWKAIRAVGREIGAVRRPERQDVAAELVTPEPTGRRRGRRGAGDREPVEVTPGRPRDEGSITVETVGVLPAVLLVVALLWQVVLVGATVVWTGHAASAAAQAAAVGDDPRQPAVDRLPGAMRSGAHVSAAGSTVQVSVPVPLVAPGLLRGPWRIGVDRQVVIER